MEEKKKKMSVIDVIVCRGIWYVVTLLSVIGLSISLNHLCPPSSSTSTGRFLRDGSISVTTLYAVTLVRNLFFSEPPSSSTCYRVFTTCKERISQVVFSELALLIMVKTLVWIHYMGKDTLFVVFIYIFIISLFTGAIGLIQLSDKFRMEIGHALITLFYGCFFCYLLRSGHVLDWVFALLYGLQLGVIILYNFVTGWRLDTSSVSPLPT